LGSPEANNKNVYVGLWARALSPFYTDGISIGVILGTNFC